MGREEDLGKASRTVAQLHCGTWKPSPGAPEGGTEPVWSSGPVHAGSGQVLTSDRPRCGCPKGNHPKGSHPKGNHPKGNPQHLGKPFVTSERHSSSRCEGVHGARVFMGWWHSQGGGVHHHVQPMHTCMHRCSQMHTHVHVCTPTRAHLTSSPGTNGTAPMEPCAGQTVAGHSDLAPPAPPPPATGASWPPTDDAGGAGGRGGAGPGGRRGGW